MMSPRMRKFALTAHVVSSTGWLGAATAILALGIAALSSEDAQIVRAAGVGTDLIWRFVILPLSVGALGTGLVQALGTPWGLFRSYWVLTKFVLTTVAIALLLLHTNSLLPALAAAAATSTAAHPASAHHAGMPPLLHLVVAASGTIVVLLVATTLSVYKPWGRINTAPPGA